MQTPVLQQGNMFALPRSKLLLGQSCNTPKFSEKTFGRKMNVGTSLISAINFHSVPFCRKAHNFHWYSVSSLSIFKVRPVCTKPMMSSPPFRRLSIFSLSHTNNSTDVFWQSTSECSNVLANISLEKCLLLFCHTKPYFKRSEIRIRENHLSTSDTKVEYEKQWILNKQEEN